MKRSKIYVLTEVHMAKLDELITEIQAVFCDIYSNRQLSVTSGLEITPASGLLNAVAENRLNFDDILGD